MTVKTLKEIYNFAYGYLAGNAKKAGLSGAELNRYFQPLNDIFQENATLDTIYDRILTSLQNRSYMPNVIKYNDPTRQKALREILGLEGVKEGFRKLKNAKTEDFLLELDKNGFLKKSQLSWMIWLDGAISGAKWLDGFKDLDEFKKKANADLPYIVSREIRGMGLVLAYDFIKEIGYAQYGKPDVHLMDIFEGLNLIDANSTDKVNDTQATLIKMAEENDVTPYKVDKIFWLIATENFYLHPEIKNPKGRAAMTRKAEFLTAVDEANGSFKF